jgi:NAD/NADP transhydrogenase beta subunit
VIVNKRSMATGYAGLDSELLYTDKIMMVLLEDSAINVIEKSSNKSLRKVVCHGLPLTR